MISRLKITVTITILVSGLFLISGCREKLEVEPGQVPPVDYITESGIELDRELTDIESATLKNDFRSIASVNLDGVPDQSPYAAIFSGSNSKATIRYLKERISYLLGKNSKIDARIQIKGISAFDSNAKLRAQNIGTALWMMKEHDAGSHAFTFRINEKDVIPESSRVGIIKIHENYISDTDINPALVRMRVLIHEARHSDCTGGVSRNELSLIISNSENIQNKTCGHFHSICPDGHEYAGLKACDDHTWGAYSVDAVYASALATKCMNCTEVEKQVAKIMALDSFSRLSSVKATEMLKGEHGLPEMSSSGVRD